MRPRRHLLLERFKKSVSHSRKSLAFASYPLSGPRINNLEAQAAIKEAESERLAHSDILSVNASTCFGCVHIASSSAFPLFPHSLPPLVVLHDASTKLRLHV